MSENKFISELLNAHTTKAGLPASNVVQQFIDALLGLIFPAYSNTRLLTEKQVATAIEVSKQELTDILFYLDSLPESEIISIVDQFFNQLPDVYYLLLKDAEAIEAGDPAAKSRDEVIRTYPGFYAISIYRIAHLLYKLNVPFVPRILTEIAHSKTGIDIHPAATIGERFFIDHGTGIVIGETTTIGNQVKLYQGVTLGALSVSKSMAETKRHPTIMNNVVIYAGATILGGNTVIGENSVIGGNVWLTDSVPANSTVYHKPQLNVEQTK
ncbi:MAG: serine O-acetyltransferase EpsC [Bacteroidia bacterium]